MKTLRIAALAVAVSGVFTLGAKAGTDTNNWWDVTFDDKLGLCDLENQTVGPDGAMVVLTNQFKQGDGETVSVQTWDSGIWYTQDGDETIVTNSYNPTNTYKAYGSDLCLKLDTQGNDLTWRVDATNTMPDSRTALVDADLYLVGSDSPPDTGDFDAAHDVQTAVYLKNETDEDTGETTNSVLCVYVYDSDAEENYWQELKGVKVEDNSWASVKVVVDHAKVIDPQNDYPVVQVFVNGVKMTARDGDTDHWTVANFTTSKTAARVSSVAFRGTGAVDNFVGKLVETTFDKYDFSAEVYMNGTLVAQGTEGNVTRVVEQVEAGAGKTAPFRNFFQDDLSVDASTMPPVFNVSYYLSKIEFTNCLTGATTTFNYSYSNYRVVPATVNEDFVQLSSTGMPPYNFSVTAPTEGATENTTLVRIYFEDVPAVGDFTLTASQNVGTAPADQKFNNKDENLPESTTFEFNQQIAAGGTDYYLSGIMTNATPAGIAVGVEDAKVVVTVPLSASIAEGAYNVATATYVEGSVAGKTAKLVPAEGGYTVAYSDPPVAIIVAGNVTNEYSSLRAAIEVASAGDTITLVADDSVSFTAETPELMIDKAITIDGGSNTLYGVSGHACATIADRHNLAISGTGDVTIKDLTMTQFSDTATVQYYTYPIWVRGAYGGTLTLDGVTITNFSRTAVNISGGAVVITNCVFAGDTTRLDANGHAFQGGVEVGDGLDAAVTIADTTITGMGSVGYPADSDSDMAAAVQMSGKGSITIESGTFAGQYSLIVSASATGGIVVNGGEFDGDVCVENGAGTLAIHDGSVVGDLEVASALTAFIDGGWFSAEPDANYIAAGLVARQIGTDPAPWTVGQSFTITFNNDDGTEFYKTNGVFTGETGYGPATDPTKGETFTFVGWTNLVAGGAAVATADLPAADGNATWTAVFKEDSVIEPIAVTIGGDAVNALPAGVEPITLDSATGFTLRFAAKQIGVTYILQAAATVDGQFADVEVDGKAVSVTPAAVDEVVALTDPDTTSTVKFFRVKVVVAE